MIYPEGDAIKLRINNRYSLVVLAAKRARQLKEGAPPLIETTSANPLTVALEEIAAGKVNYIEGVEHHRDDEARDVVTDSAAVLEDGFLTPLEAPRPASPFSDELAAFMDPPEASLDEDESDDVLSEDDEEPGLEPGSIADESLDPTEDSEA